MIYRQLDIFEIQLRLHLLTMRLLQIQQVEVDTGNGLMVSRKSGGVLNLGTTYTLKCGGFSNTTYTITVGFGYYNNNVTKVTAISTTAVGTEGGPSTSVALSFYCAGY